MRLGACQSTIEQLDAEGVRALAGSSTVATLLPDLRSCSATTCRRRALPDAGATVALATDANAGTYANPSMPLVIGPGRGPGMTVEEAVAATSSGAAAIGLSTDVGVIQEGMAADLVGR